MIKKSVFEDELIAGMQRELRPYEEKQGMENLVKAVEYLQAAAEIFEEAGFTAKADQVLKILVKIATGHKSHKPGDTIEFKSLMHEPKKKPEDTIEFKSLLKGKPSDKPLAEDEVSFESLLNDDQDARGKPKKPKNPTHVSDTHTHGLTSEKMIENLKQHGVVFNMADDGAADDLLNADVNDKGIEVVEGENSYEKTFEDSD